MKIATVLVVDDDPCIIALLAAALDDAGYRVLDAVGAGALTVARTQQPDVILLDITMPGMDGAAVSRHLRSDPATAAIPIIVMSAHEAIGDPAMRIAADDRLPKPFELPDLYRVVAHWTTVRPQRPSPEAEGSWLSPGDRSA